jgi:hypothetical protein
MSGACQGPSPDGGLIGDYQSAGFIGVHGTTLATDYCSHPGYDFNAATCTVVVFDVRTTKLVGAWQIPAPVSDLAVDGSDLVVETSVFLQAKPRPPASFLQAVSIYRIGIATGRGIVTRMQMGDCDHDSQYSQIPRHSTIGDGSPLAVVGFCSFTLTVFDTRSGATVANLQNAPAGYAAYEGLPSGSVQRDASGHLWQFYGHDLIERDPTTFAPLSQAHIDVGSISAALGTPQMNILDMSAGSRGLFIDSCRGSSYSCDIQHYDLTRVDSTTGKVLGHWVLPTPNAKYCTRCETPPPVPVNPDDTGFWYGGNGYGLSHVTL